MSIESGSIMDEVFWSQKIWLLRDLLSKPVVPLARQESFCIEGLDRLV